jgi:hypothetical protein
MQFRRDIYTIHDKRRPTRDTHAHRRRRIREHGMRTLSDSECTHAPPAAGARREVVVGHPSFPTGGATPRVAFNAPPASARVRPALRASRSPSRPRGGTAGVGSAAERASWRRTNREALRSWPPRPLKPRRADRTARMRLPLANGGGGEPWNPAPNYRE